MSIWWDLRRPPTLSWTSLIGSSPGHMQSGRQSHINQKSKEALFYEHLPVPTSYRLIFYWRKFATEPYIRDALVAVLQFSLNFYVRDILIGVLMYTKYAHGQLRCSEKREHLFSETCTSNSKKAKRHLSNS